MVSRIFNKELQDWRHKKLDWFVSQQAQLHRWGLGKLKEEILYSELAIDQYKIFWWKFLEEIYN